MDNCWRENKNKFVLSYLSYLIKCNIFSEIYLNFLRVGHTHNDCDQRFFLIASVFKETNALTIEDVHANVKKGLTEESVVTHVTEFPNFKELCELNNFTNNIQG